MTNIADDIRYLPWEGKRPRKIRPLRHEPPPPLTIERLETAPLPLAAREIPVLFLRRSQSRMPLVLRNPPSHVLPKGLRT